MTIDLPYDDPKNGIPMTDGGSYQWTKPFKTAPEKLSGGVMVILNAVVSAGWWTVSAATLGSINIILTTVLTLLYVTPNVSSNYKLAKLQQAQDTAALNALDLGTKISPVTNIHNVTLQTPQPPPEREARPEPPRKPKKPKTTVRK